MQRQKPQKARRQTDAEIQAAVKKFNIQEDYDTSRAQLLAMLDAATEDSQEALAGFMFAFTSISNEIARRNNIR